jgi:ABC-type phosphate/phosphonate transport system ATPase subunit
MMTVNGMDFCIPQKGVSKKGNTFASHKYAGKSALLYELGVVILVGDLVLIQGPYPAGKYTNIKIFNKILQTSLSEASGLRPMRATAAILTNYSAPGTV